MRNFLENLVIILLSFSLCGLIFCICNIKTEKAEKQDFFDEKSAFSNLTISCIGDSITMATKVEKSYPTCLQEELGLKNVYNYGVSWSTVGYMENCHCHTDSDFNHDPYVFRYSDIQEADIIAVMGGINDFGCLLPLGEIDDNEPSTFYGALNILAKGLQAEFPNSYIFFMTGFDYYGIAGYNQSGTYWYEYNDAIIAVCEKYGIDCFDVYNEIIFDRDTYTMDGVHPTQEFIECIWVPKISAFIQENYK